MAQVLSECVIAERETFLRAISIDILIKHGRITARAFGPPIITPALAFTHRETCRKVPMASLHHIIRGRLEEHHYLKY